MQAIDYKNVRLTGGFWREMQLLNRNVTIRAVETRFRKTGRFNAFRMDWKEGMPDKPHIFWDSDIAKWVEAVAYILHETPDKELRASAEEVIDRIIENQDESGYFNIYFTVVEPESRFTRQSDHELYCAGHLIEAAVAYYEAVGEDRFLRAMIKYADYIEKVFVIDKSAPFITPGHEEIELALVRLYECTNEPRYLGLARFFTDERGTENDRKYGPTYAFEDFNKLNYSQRHLPVREQKTAQGHAVRAAYLYSAMADLARIDCDAGLRGACESLANDIISKKMYVTGGIGSAYTGEAFTKDYDLPPLTAYAETCAAYGLVLFLSRMTRISPDSRYADAAERALYNGFVSGLSLDGKSFFYENPLEIDLAAYSRNTATEKSDFRLPITQRKTMFDCSCCPPNINRALASFGGFLYTHDGETLYVNHYADSETQTKAFGGDLSVTQKTSYPESGTVEINLRAFSGRRIALRIPAYSANGYTIVKNGSAYNPQVLSGYAFIDAKAGDTITLELDMGVKLYSAHPCVRESDGRAAVTRGPVVYCAEGVDNGGALYGLTLKKDGGFLPEKDGLLGCTVLVADGYKRVQSDLYESLPAKYEPHKIKLIPYRLFANRGESDMKVWMPIL